jgi:hypothetical protein
MKHFALSLTAVFLCLFCMHAYSQKGFNIGINGSRINDKIFGSELPNALIYDEVNYHSNFNNGFSFGLTFRYGFNETFGISTGINKGYRRIKTTISSANASLSNSEMIDMLEFPLEMTYRQYINKDKSMTWNTHIGWSFGFINTMNYESAAYVTPIYISNYSTIQQDRGVINTAVIGTGLEKNFGEYGNIYLGISFHHPIFKDIIFSSFYEIGTSNDFISEYLHASYLDLDFTYYMPWRAMTGKN